MKYIIILLAIFFSSMAWASSVTFEWDASSENDLIGYKFYQSQLSGSYPGDPIEIILAGTETVTIEVAEGRWYWVVTAYNPAGESGYSNEVTAQIDPEVPDTTPPDVPTNLIVTVGTLSFVMSLWGKTDEDYESSNTTISGMMGGLSPDEDNMKITAIKILAFINSGDDDIRLAVYAGGSVDNPEGAVLLWDAGVVNIDQTDATWFEIVHPTGGIEWDKNTLTWLAWKRDNVVEVGCEEKPPDDETTWGDFQSARGRYRSDSLDEDPDMIWPENFPDAGGFSGWWYNIYVVYKNQ